MGQVSSNTQLVGQGKERTGHLRIRGKAVGLTVRQDVPDGNEQLAGAGHLRLLRSRLPAQAFMLDVSAPLSAGGELA